MARQGVLVVSCRYLQQMLVQVVGDQVATVICRPLQRVVGVAVLKGTLRPLWDSSNCRPDRLPLGDYGLFRWFHPLRSDFRASLFLFPHPLHLHL